MIELRSNAEVPGMQQAGDLDAVVEEFLLSEGARSPYRGYRPSPHVPPFPGAICAAVNEQVVHGFPIPRKLREGDVVGIDVGAVFGWWVGDACYTFPVGKVPLRVQSLLDIARECLEAGLAEVWPGQRLGDVGAAIEEHAEHHGYGVVREVGGHGVGRTLHEEPYVNHFGRRGHGMRLRKGMTFTVEPMINEGSSDIRFLEDGWTVVTADGKLSAQYEHTVVVTSGGCEILTPRFSYKRDAEGPA